MESASNSFKRTGLLLANRTDVLHELVQYEHLDDETPSHRGQKRQRRMLQAGCASNVDINSLVIICTSCNYHPNILYTLEQGNIFVAFR